MPEDTEKKILNTLVKGAGITFSGMMFSKFISYLYRLMIARIGPDAYGQFSQALAVVAIVSVVCGLSVGNGLEKFIPEFRKDENKARIKGIVISALQMTSIVSLILGGLLFLAAPYISSILTNSSDLTLYIRILSIIPLFTRMYEIFMDTLTAFKKIEYKVISTNIFESIVQVTTTAGLLLLGWQVTGAIVGYLVSTFLGMILAFYFMEKKIGPILTDRDTESVLMRRELLTYSLPLLGVSIMNVGMGQMDTLFLGYFSTDAAVGLYNAAYPTAVLLSIPATAIGSLALTSFSEIRQEDDSSVKNTLRSLARWGFMLTFPGLLGLSIFSEEILTLLFGSAYAPAAAAMTILAVGYVFNSSLGQMMSFLKAESENRFILKAQVVNFVLNAGLNIYLIPIYGITGAAIGTTTSTIVFGLLLLYRSHRLEGVLPWESHMLKIVFSSVASIALVYGAMKLIFETIPPVAVFPAGFIYFLLYLGLYALLGIKDEDWDMWYRILEKLRLLNLWKSIFS